MSIKIKPQSKKVIAVALKTKNFVTSGGIEIVDTKLSEAKVVEVSEELYGIYNEGDIILYPKDSGIGIFYNKEHSIFLRQDEIWGVVSESKDAPKKSKTK